jgi:hypothetical protein
MLSANKNKSDKTNDENYDWVWKMWTFLTLDYLYAK